MSQALQFEFFLRGATAGMTFIIFMHFIAHFRSGWPARLGALFTFATTLWVPYSSMVLRDVFGVFIPVASFFATFNSVFFWWFATSLFDDRFEWRAWRFAPFVIIAIIQLARRIGPGSIEADIAFFAHEVLVLTLMGHTMYLALSDAVNDLIEERRQFRVLFAVTVAATGIAVTMLEVTNWFTPVYVKLSLFQATALFIPAVIFAYKLLAMNISLLGDPPLAVTSTQVSSGASASPTLRAIDRPIFDKLIALMEAGTHHREGLTVSQLATDLGTPAHVLRRLINQELGYRNFSAFLNQWRIADAKSLLSDPERGRQQVVQIALEVGYGSIGPFNRAFKEATGLTPTEFRSKALN